MKVDYLGRWDIDSMELWPKDYIDCNEPGHFLIAADGTGNFIFGAVEASIDGYYCKETGRFEYTFQGTNDRDPICGRGWFFFESSETGVGSIFIHMGDVSAIELQRHET